MVDLLDLLLCGLAISSSIPPDPLDVSIILRIPHKLISKRYPYALPTESDDLLPHEDHLAPAPESVHQVVLIDGTPSVPSQSIRDKELLPLLPLLLGPPLHSHQGPVREPSHLSTGRGSSLLPYKLL